MVAVAFFIAMLLLVAGVYLIARPSTFVGNFYSPRGRLMLVVVQRVAGAAMVGLALAVLYLSFWTVTCGPCSGR